jgi:SPASM domain peptide maturase of grasp-with-spasm system
MKYFILLDSVKIVCGHKRALLYDTNNNFNKYIPLDLYHILIDSQNQNLFDFYKKFDAENLKVIKEYFQFLIKNKLGFFCNNYKEASNFIKKQESFILPFSLSYLIIDLENINDFSDFIINEILKNKIKYLQIRLLKEIELEEFEIVLQQCENLKTSFIEEISFVLKFKNEIYSFFRTNNFLRTKYLDVIFFSTPNNLENETLNNVSFVFLNDVLQIPISCGNIKSENFVLNEKFYLESQHHNTCLNRKIAIDKNGDIKNCPSMPQSFGNIKNTSLEEALNHPDFKKYWNINKNQIEVCKDCEFRHICTDCRAYTENPDDQYSKPLKCGYNPYTNVWEEWSTNPLKQKAIEFYGMQNLIKKI